MRQLTRIDTAVSLSSVRAIHKYMGKQSFYMDSNNYPPDWDNRRKKVYKRDSYKCQNCGIKGRKQGTAELHAHHIVPKAKGGTHKLSNLKTMCSECHKAIHGEHVAPTSDQTVDINAENISEITDISQLAGEAGEIIDLFEKMRSLPILSSHSKVNIEESKNKGLLEDIHKHRHKLSNNVSLQYRLDEHQDVADRFVRTNLQFLQSMLGALSSINTFRETLLTVECPNCEASQKESADYCGNCGSKLPLLWECPECHSTVNTIENGFCKHCGEELEDAPPKLIKKYKSNKANMEEKVEMSGEKMKEMSNVLENVTKTFG
jgi:hypothetical protein